MRIAIVGAGIAGLSAAWRLSEHNDVVVYERAVRAGGHAVTVPVATAEGQRAVDAGFLLFDDWQYPTFSALLQTLEVEVEPVQVSISYAGRYGEWSTFQQDTELWRRVREEAIKFSREAPAMAMLPRDVSLADYLREKGFSREFRHACLLPLIGVLLVNRAALFEIPAWLVGAGFSRLFSFFAPTTYFRVRNGKQAYVDVLLAKIGLNIRLETAVRSISRSGSGVLVWDDQRRSERFDRVVLAVDASTALRLLEDPSEQEQRVLGAAQLATTEVVVHVDGSVVSGAGGARTFFNYRERAEHVEGPEDGRGQCTIDIFGRPDGPFVTWDAPGEAIAAEKVVAKFALNHLVYSSRWAQTVSDDFPQIQGVRNTLFCGGHSAGFPSHEGALVSGLAAAHALGASYPFADRRALAAFNLVRRHYNPAARVGS